MWFRVIEFVLSAGSYVFNWWQNHKLQKAAEDKLLKEQAEQTAKEVKDAEKVKAAAVNNADLLLSPDQRGHNED